MVNSSLSPCHPTAQGIEYLDGIPIYMVFGSSRLMVLQSSPPQKLNMSSKLYRTPMKRTAPYSLSNTGLPIMSTPDFSQLTLDQLNNRTDLLQQSRPHTDQLIKHKRCFDIVNSGAVLNYTNKAMKLTQGRLIQPNNWNDWQLSEFLQLDQYKDQGMFRAPIQASSNVWCQPWHQATLAPLPWPVM